MLAGGPVLDGIVGWWPGDGHAADLVGDNDGVLRNGAMFSTGVVGEAFRFDGIDDYVSVGNASSLDLSHGDFTVETWVRFDSLVRPLGVGIAPRGDMSIVDKMLSPVGRANFDGWRLLKQNNGRFWFCFGGGNTNGCTRGPTTVQSTTIIETQQWYHVAATKRSNEITIYVNGTLEATKRMSASITDSNSADLRFGEGDHEKGAYLNGLIDEVSLYNRALTADEIRSIYDSGADGTGSPIPSIRLGGTSFEEPLVGALNYMGVGGEIGFIRTIDGNGDGTFGDEDAGGVYGVIDSSPRDNGGNFLIVSDPLFIDGDQGYAAVGSNGGAAQQPLQQLSFDPVRWDTDRVSGVRLSLDVYVASRGYEPGDSLQVVLQATDENGTDVLSVLDVTGTQIEDGSAGLTEAQWNSLSFTMDDRYDSAQLIITSSTNATSLGEGFIFDNIIFTGLSLLPSSDLTGNGFVDFEDLTVLLANWNKDVTAAEGNIVEPLVTVVNFEDLTVLLAEWTGPGPEGLFGEQNIISADADKARSVFAADVDGDGDMDVLSASSGKVAWYENDGSGSFTAHTISSDISAGWSVYAADVDGDGDIDVLSASHEDDGKIAWYENDGSQNFTAHTIGADNAGARGVVAVDVDGDGDIDVLGSSLYGESRIAWYENDGNEVFTAHTLSVVADSAFSVFAADVNGDDKIDVISASGNSIGWWENGSGDFTKHVFGGEGEIHSVFAADVDGDGDTDLLTAARFSNTIAWFENDGSQNFTRHAISTDVQFARSVFAADLDGDGDIDVLSASAQDDKIAWYENDGSQNFTAHTISTATDAASGVFAVDLDGDGDLDVLSASSKDGKIAWYENLSPIPEPTADLTGNGFVDFEDLTVLLANWNKDVTAAEGNIVEPLVTVVNFEDLTVLLAEWTGPGPAGSPVVRGLAATIAPVGRRLAAAPAGESDERREDSVGWRDVEVETSSRTESLKRRGKPAAYGTRRTDMRASALRRLQAATDRALADYEPDELEHRETHFARRWRRGR